jgi:hypothetical protein
MSRGAQTTVRAMSIVLLVSSAFPPVVAFGEYTIDWWTIDGGGEMWCTGGDYELSGAIGQCEAGLALTGGDYELTGGFVPGLQPASACTCGDIDGSGGLVDLSDFATFALCFGLPAPNPPDCDQAAFECSDLDGDGSVNLNDFATFATRYGLQSTQAVPNCGQG